MSGIGRMPLRSWLAIALAAMVLIPLLSWFGLILALQGPTKSQAPPWESRSKEALNATLALVQNHPDEWRTPTFQAELRTILKRGRYAMNLFDADGELLFQEGSFYELTEREGSQSVTHLLTSYGSRTHIGNITSQDGRPLGSFVLVRSPEDPSVSLFLLTALGAATLALFLLVKRLAQSLNAPLKALAAATRQINQGDLDVSLPRSRVKELDELGLAFGSMRDGLKESIQRQAALEEERRFFIAAIAHDLRTPLSSVRGYLEGLQDGVAQTPEQVGRYVSTALEKARALERLIESFFTYARSEYLEQPPDHVDLELAELLHEAAAAVRPLAEAKGVTLQFDGETEPCHLQGDRQMLTRILDNLLENGLRHTPPGGQLTLGWRAEGENCCLWVQDDGPGIPPEQLAQIFEPHYRGDAARSSHTGGAGLGLAIARRLVEAHQGSIAAASQGGARFTVVFPREPSQ